MPTSWIAPGSVERLVLTGDGGDEALAGYERFPATLLADHMRLPAQRGTGAMARQLPRSASYHRLRRCLERFVGEPSRRVLDRYFSWIAAFGRGSLARVLTPELTQDASASAFASYACEFERAGDVGLLHRLLSLNLLRYLQDDLLVKTDRMPMANSLEARSPFADTVLLEDLGALPPWMKATPLGLKRVLPSALRYRLPRRILHRRKHGFGVPAGRWFGGELRGPFEERVLDPGARTRETLQRGAAGALLDQHLSSRVDPGPRLWSLFVLQMWLRQLERPPTPGLPPHADVAIAERNPS